MDATPHSVTAPTFAPPVCLRQLSPDGVPPVPVDAGGRHMSWVLVLASGSVHYGGELREWDLGELVEAFATYTADGYEPPVIAEHDPGVTRGERLGDLVEIREHDGGVIGLVRWVSPTAAEAIATGAIRYMSPGIGKVELHDTGDVIETVFEISVVTAPHQRGADTHVLAKEQRMSEQNEASSAAAEETGPSLEEQVSALVAAAIKQHLAEHAEEDDDEAEMEDEDKDLAAQVVALRDELAVVRRDRDFAAFCAVVKAGDTITLTDASIEALFVFSQSTPDEFAKLAGASKAAPVAKPTARLKWAARHGSGDTAEPTSKPTNAIELKALCLAETGGDEAKATALFVKRAPKMGIL